MEEIGNRSINREPDQDQRMDELSKTEDEQF